jgi:hypothetical protein
MADLDAPTPVNIQRRCSEPGGPPERQFSGAVAVISSPASKDAPAPAGAEVVISPRQQCSPADTASVCSPLAGTAAEGDAAAADGAAAGEGSVAAELSWLSSSIPEDYMVGEDDEEGYLEYEVPLEQRISLLEVRNTLL